MQKHRLTVVVKSLGLGAQTGLSINPSPTLGYGTVGKLPNFLLGFSVLIHKMGTIASIIVMIKEARAANILT